LFQIKTTLHQNLQVYVHIPVIPVDLNIGPRRGTVSRHRSKNIQVQLNEQQRLAFQKLRNILASEDVILKKAFDLTTDASAHGIGAVLSQEGRPINMISRTLKDREVNYATNERELLAIVWALAKLCSQGYKYLY